MKPGFLLSANSMGRLLRILVLTAVALAASAEAMP